MTDREGCFKLCIREGLSVEETTELRSECQAGSRHLTTRGKRFPGDRKFYHIIKRKKKRRVDLGYISGNSNISKVQGYLNPVPLRSSQLDLLCVNLNPELVARELSKVPGFTQNIRQRYFLLMLFYFKSKKMFPRNLYQAFPVWHWPEYGHLPILHSIPDTEEITLYWLAWAWVPSSMPNKGLGTPWLALTIQNYTSSRSQSQKPCVCNVTRERGHLNKKWDAVREKLKVNRS